MANSTKKPKSKKRLIIIVICIVVAALLAICVISALVSTVSNYGAGIDRSLNALSKTNLGLTVDEFAKKYTDLSKITRAEEIEHTNLNELEDLTFLTNEGVTLSSIEYKFVLANMLLNFDDDSMLTRIWIEPRIDPSESEDIMTKYTAIYITSLLCATDISYDEFVLRFDEEYKKQSSDLNSGKKIEIEIDGVLCTIDPYMVIQIFPKEIVFQ